VNGCWGCYRWRSSRSTTTAQRGLTVSARAVSVCAFQPTTSRYADGICEATLVWRPRRRTGRAWRCAGRAGTPRPCCASCARPLGPGRAGTVPSSCGRRPRRGSRRRPSAQLRLKFSGLVWARPAAETGEPCRASVAPARDWRRSRPRRSTSSAASARIFR
jgi:hypothetical protein